MPAPPITVSTASAIRTSVASTPRYWAMPAATPAIMRPWAGPYSWSRGGWLEEPAWWPLDWPDGGQSCTGGSSDWAWLCGPWLEGASSAGCEVNSFMTSSLPGLLARGYWEQPGLDPDLASQESGQVPMPVAGYFGDDGYVDEPTQSPDSPGPPLPGQAPSWGQPFGLPNGQPSGQQSAGQQSAGQPQPPRADQPPPACSHQHRGPDCSAGVSSLRRANDGRIAGGIAAGIAARTGMHVGIVRTIFIILALITGFGLAVYVVAWLFIPAVGENNNIASRAITDLRGIAIAAVAASMLVVVLVLVTILGIGLFGKFGWPIVIAAAGLVLIWRNASADEQASLQRLAAPLVGSSAGKMRSKLGLRLLIAGVLLIIGLTVLASAHHPLLILRPLGGLVLVLAAIGVVLGPWWLRIVRDLVVERQARIRAEERADIASRVHDSVLQTLA